MEHFHLRLHHGLKRAVQERGHEIFEHKAKILPSICDNAVMEALKMSLPMFGYVLVRPMHSCGVEIT